jgi:cyclin-dependent kinase regulatory subunit CKS1
MLKAIPKEYFDGSRGTLKLLWEEEWRALGITQSLGWEHYEVHEPEPHILLFKYEETSLREVVTVLTTLQTTFVIVRSRHELWGDALLRTRDWIEL